MSINTAQKHVSFFKNKKCKISSSAQRTASIERQFHSFDSMKQGHDPYNVQFRPELNRWGILFFIWNRKRFVMGSKLRARDTSPRS